jgi:DNA-nicking Smr family endonuclease
MRDEDDFERAMKDVARLKPDARGKVRAAAQSEPVHVRKTSPPPAAKKVGASDELESENGYAAPGVDRRELRKLKRGDHLPGDRLDVHGMTSAKALAAVQQFIASRRAHHRCIAIVHGRGLHSAGNVAVLKTKVRELLRDHPAVLAFTDAPRTDGGPGAVYVLLRRV